MVWWVMVAWQVILFSWVVVPGDLDVEEAVELLLEDGRSGVE